MLAHSAWRRITCAKWCLRPTAKAIAVGFVKSYSRGRDVAVQVQREGRRNPLHWDPGAGGIVELLRRTRESRLAKRSQLLTPRRSSPRRDFNPVERVGTDSRSNSLIGVLGPWHGYLRNDILEVRGGILHVLL
jgi:hypothetical protein